jgi:hypothetical protein
VLTAALAIPELVCLILSAALVYHKTAAPDDDGNVRSKTLHARPFRAAHA